MHQSALLLDLFFITCSCWACLCVVIQTKLVCGTNMLETCTCWRGCCTLIGCEIWKSNKVVETLIRIQTFSERKRYGKRVGSSLVSSDSLAEISY